MRSIGCKENAILYIGIFLINLIAFPILISTLFFMLGISVNIYNLALAVLFDIIMILIVGNDKKVALRAIIVGLLIFLTVTFICMRSYDWSWDGNTYHKSMIGLLKNGWNPLYQTFYAYAEKFDFLGNIYESWYDAYPKGAEIWASCIYYIVGNIEAGKAYTLTSVIGTGLVGYTLIEEVGLLNKWSRILLVVMCVLNPVVISQCFTFYVDAFMWEMLLLFLMALLYLTVMRKGQYEKWCFYLVFLSINIGFNIKFSGIIFWGVFGLAIFCYWLLEYKKCNLVGKQLTIRFVVMSLSVVFGIVFTGASSYIVNLIRHRNPFYTMIGEGKSEMIVAQLAPVYEDMSNVERFIVSMFSRTSNSLELEQVDWKIPLFVEKRELYDAVLYDCRTAGWGIFFSAIFIISLVAIVAFLISEGKNFKLLTKLSLYIMAIILGLVIIVPGMNWARYSIVIFLIPVIAVSFCIVLMSSYKRANIQHICHCTIVVLVILSLLNCMPNIYKNFDVLCDFSLQEQEMSEMKEFSDQQVVYIDQNNPFYGIYFNYLDKGITNWELAELGDRDNIRLTFSPGLSIRYALEMNY